MGGGGLVSAFFLSSHVIHQFGDLGSSDKAHTLLSE